MSDYFRILYVNTRLARDDSHTWPWDIDALRSWSWTKSALVRWAAVEPVEVVAQLATAKLLVLDWAVENPPPAIEVYSQIRSKTPDFPILAVEYFSGLEPVRDSHATSDPRLAVMSGSDLQDPALIAAAFSRLGVALPAPRLRLDIESSGLADERLVQWVGEERLRLTLEKFFPDADSIRLESVASGWSDCAVIRAHVRGKEGPYLVRLFNNSMEYRKELQGYESVRAWLGNATVGLRLVPGINTVEQVQAFPPMQPFVFPVCYESAWTRDHPRETFNKVYRFAKGRFLEEATRRLLSLLSAGQPVAPLRTDSEPPWSDLGQSRMLPSDEMKRTLLTTIDDLSLYGPALCRGDWDVLRHVLESLMHNALPTWLSQYQPVIRGHVHGDPNPRNCLVSVNDPQDLVLIDFRDFEPNGRLVSDLAIFERDIKLVMMGCEDAVKKTFPFYDLDVRHLADWCDAERKSICKGLKFTSRDAPVAAGQYSSARRAYRLVGLVRKRAREVSGDWDPQGQHYFAALLYWTLEALRNSSLRPTKKLLALYSAAEILRAFS